MSLSGKDNPNWRGGKTITSHGYVALLVGRTHHLADPKGYAYEHRIIAEQILGRKLFSNEIIHHKDGNRQNNKPSNIQVCPSIAHHCFYHRKNDTRKKPDENNLEKVCACGCGQTFLKYDQWGRPRRFVTGRNTYLLGSLQKQILNIIKINRKISRLMLSRMCETSLASIA